MDIQKIKSILKERKITYDKLAEMTGLSKSCITKIFAGYAKYPRVDTVEIIEKALGLNEDVLPEISQEERELIELIKQLDEEQTKELSSFVDFLISKRK